jgi:Tol biopolymer transport system component
MGAAWARTLGLAALLALGVAPAAQAQFGQNKVQYQSFDWRVLETDHFQIHFYTEEREAAEEAARMAERGYTYLSTFFDHQFEEKIPLILYSRHQDFEQSNVISGLISEGTGGVTESLKGRVTLPLTGSYAELNHVLVHELVHAFQFDMLRRTFLGQSAAASLPLWMMEGMAEWVSNGMDPVTAMWVMDAKRSDKVPSVQDMSSVYDIRVYRMGQALYEVIAANFGPERVQRILKRPSERRGIRADSTFTPLPPPTTAVSTAPGAETPHAFGTGTSERQSLENLWRAYVDSLATVLGTGLVEPDSIAEKVAGGDAYGRSYHLAPALSPDGQRILFYSSRGFHNELFVAERRESGWKTRALVTGARTAELEDLPLLSASADWAPDQKHVVFVATKQGRDVLQILDVDKRRIRRTIETELMSIHNPSYSPDGQWVVFTALAGGVEDLYVVNVESGALVRLTQDAYSERTPRFSPDGNAIIFATDRGPETDLDDLVFGPWNVARMDVRRAGGQITGGSVSLVIESSANEFSAVWSPDGGSVAFVSDRAGTYQVYTYDFATGEVRQRTRFASGVVGIVPTGPAISWGVNGDIVYTVFHHGGWHLYRTQGFPLDGEGGEDEARMQMTRSAPAEIQQNADPDLSSTEKNYRTRLTPEYAVIGGLYVGNTGAAGSGALLLGDMLGNQYIYLGARLSSDFDESEILLQYANQGHRWQWGVGAYQFREDYVFYSGPNYANVESNVRRGVGAQAWYPFNRFRRLEFSVDLQSLDRQTSRFLVVNNSYAETARLQNDRVYYALPGAALVFDNASFAGYTAVAGKRWRAEFNQALGDLRYQFYVLDYRRYFNVAGRGALAARLLTATSSGRNREQLWLGGPYTFRGADFGEIAGTTVAAANFEARFPIFPGTELLRGVVFYDVATSWGHGTARYGIIRGSVAFSQLEARDIQTAVGVGLRGFIGLPLRFDAAIPINSPRESLTFFSMGFDF